MQAKSNITICSRRHFIAVLVSSGTVYIHGSETDFLFFVLYRRVCVLLVSFFVVTAVSFRAWDSMYIFATSHGH